MISLPKTWIFLDGSQSHDDIAITWCQWEQTKGPNTAKFEDASKVKTNVTRLTKGEYRYEV